MSNTTTNQVHSISIDTATMLMSFNASVWTARKLDKGVTDEVLHDKGAGAKGAARVNKSLMAGRTELVDIQAVVGAARTYVYENTAEWANGQRWIPTNRLLKVDKRMSDFKQEFTALSEAFFEIYPSLISGQAFAMGNMFIRSEYPSVSEIRRKFAFSYDFDPMPVTNDFRVAIPAEAQADLRTRLEKANTRRIDEAMSGLRKQLGDHLRRMAERLVSVEGKDGELKQQRFHDTLVTNAYELCDLIGDFNVAGDADLSAAKTQLEKVLAGTTAETLRIDPDRREEVRVEVNKMLDAWSF